MLIVYCLCTIIEFKSVFSLSFKPFYFRWLELVYSKHDSDRRAYSICILTLFQSGTYFWKLIKDCNIRYQKYILKAYLFRLSFVFCLFVLFFSFACLCCYCRQIDQSFSAIEYIICQKFPQRFPHDYNASQYFQE